tara:strand:+ start:500 stop:880 length:381 start_codon:yes stop_codon:yes gene_type:complete
MDLNQSQLKLLLAIAVLIIGYLIIYPNCSPKSEKNQRKAKLEIFKNAMGITGDMRRMVPREDNKRQTVLVGISESCPSGFTVAPAGFNLSNGGCHVTCGGGGQCGDEDGNDQNGVPVPQKCCQQNI